MCTETTTSLFLHNYPIIKLNNEEIENPYIVIEDFFSFGHWPDIREMMWNMFKTTVTGTWPKDSDRRERKEIVHLYEYLERLVKAAHLINEQRKKEEMAQAA